MPEQDDKPMNNNSTAAQAEGAGGEASGDTVQPAAGLDAELAAEAAAFAEMGAEAGEVVAQLEAERDDLKDRLMRALAETENLRRRAQREKEDMAKYSVSNFARDMLDVADNLGRALDSIPDTDDELLNAISEGVRVTEKVLANTLERHGIKGIEADNNPFDPNLHQAMFEIDNPSVPSGTVLQVMQKGYLIHDRLLRPAMVGVSKGGPKPTPAANPGAQSGGEPGEA